MLGIIYLILILMVVVDAIGDGSRTIKHSKLHHLCESMQVFLSLILFFTGYLIGGNKLLD